jgi:hypothetical protein
MDPGVKFLAAGLQTSSKTTFLRNQLDKTPEIYDITVFLGIQPQELDAFVPR